MKITSSSIKNPYAHFHYDCNEYVRFQKDPLKTVGEVDYTNSVPFILFYPITLEGCWGTTYEFTTIPFHLVQFSADLVELAKSIPVHSLMLSSHFFFCLPFLFFLSLCPVGLSLLNQKTLKHGQTILAFVSWSWSGVCHILQWIFTSFCDPPHW